MMYSVNDTSPILKVGITGGIGVGKSFVTVRFRSLYATPVLSSDRAVQNEIMKYPRVKEKVISLFGDEAYLSSGCVDRDFLRPLLFNNKENLAKINALITPELKIYIDNWTKDLERLKKEVDLIGGKYTLIECAVIYENEIEDLFDKVIVVTAPLEVRLKRLEKRGLSKENALAVIAVQLPDEELKRRASFIINNDGTTDIDTQIKEFHNLI